MPTLRRATFSPGTHPDRVDLLISDADAEEEAKVWIRARFPIEGRGDQKHSVLVLEALNRLLQLLDEAHQDAQRPLSHTP